MRERQEKRHTMSCLHSYCIFETANGFCGIAWSEVGVTRFQLPVKSAEAAERLMLRRTPDAAHYELEMRDVVLLVLADHQELGLVL